MPRPSLFSCALLRPRAWSFAAAACVAVVGAPDVAQAGNPDLRVKSISIRDADSLQPPVRQEPIEARVEVENLGASGTLNPLSVRCEFSSGQSNSLRGRSSRRRRGPDPNVGEKTTSAWMRTGAKSTITVRMPTGGVSGKVQLTCTVDPRRRIAETNESNNARKITVSVPALRSQARYALEFTSVDDRLAYYEDDLGNFGIKLKVRVRNTGTKTFRDRNGGPIFCRFDAYNSYPLARANVGALKPGQQVTRTIYSTAVQLRDMPSSGSFPIHCYVRYDLSREPTATSQYHYLEVRHDEPVRNKSGTLPPLRAALQLVTLSGSKDPDSDVPAKAGQPLYMRVEGTSKPPQNQPISVRCEFRRDSDGVLVKTKTSTIAPTFVYARRWTSVNMGTLPRALYRAKCELDRGNAVYQDSNRANNSKERKFWVN